MHFASVLLLVSKWTSIDPCGWGFTRESSVPCLNAHRFSRMTCHVVQLTKQQLLPMSAAKKTGVVRSLQEIYFRSLSTHCIVLATWPPNPTMQRVTSCSRNRYTAWSNAYTETGPKVTLRLLARKITKGIHSCKPASLNRPITRT